MSKNFYLGNNKVSIKSCLDAIFLDFDTIALSFVCDKYCLIMD